MPRIPSPNRDLPQVAVPTGDPGYAAAHPSRTKKGGIPMAFQITSPFNRHLCLLPHALVLHVNPMSLQETHTQKVERFQTRGGWVEQHWGHDLVEISADQTTGAFMDIQTGLTAVLRHRTIAWDRFRDLHDLFRNNGSVYDPNGAIVLQGAVMLMYDKGVYLGTFRSFEWEETDETPFSFSLNWTFKVEETITVVDTSFALRGLYGAAPAFQSQNANVPTSSGGGAGGFGGGVGGAPNAGSVAQPPTEARIDSAGFPVGTGGPVDSAGFPVGRSPSSKTAVPTTSGSSKGPGEQRVQAPAAVGSDGTVVFGDDPLIVPR